MDKSANGMLNPSEVKQGILNIMIAVDSFCRINGIKYSLAYGTLIGAVRHNGFIPWDDDIDIWMPRPDYNRFIKEFKHDTFVFHSMETDSDWPLIFGKVCDERYSAIDEFGKDFGLFVDIFPIDGLPDNDRTISAYYRKIRFLEKLWSNQVLTSRLTITSQMPLKKRCKILIARVLGMFVKKEHIIDSFVRASSKYDFNTASRCCVVTEGHFIFDKEAISEYTLLPFEGNSFMAAKGYDELLHSLFGNYMELPPVEQRINHGLKVTVR